MPGPVLRPLAVGDLDALVELEREAAVVAFAHIFPQETHPFPVDAVRQRWAGELADPGVRCFAVVDDGVLGGFAATRGDELLHFGTALSRWGSGLAGRAHDELLDVFRADGHERAWLRVMAENHRAIRFYERRGWVPDGETSHSPFAPYPVLLHHVRDLRDQPST